MTNQEILELWDRFDRSAALYVKITTETGSLELDRRGNPAPAAAAPVPPVPTAESAPEAADGLYIRAPLVGTFYTAPSPDQPPFVQPGDRVSRGQAVCLMEAMKMMSEVTAPWDCVIEDVLAANGTLAAYDAPLFRCRKV